MTTARYMFVTILFFFALFLSATMVFNCLDNHSALNCFTSHGWGYMTMFD